MPRKKMTHWVYHGTDPDNLPGIRTCGLRPACASASHKALVYFTDDYYFAEYHGPAVLRFAQPRDMVEVTFMDDGEEQSAWGTPSVVPPSKLELRVGTRWVKL
jgi:hypothetical protein